MYILEKHLPLVDLPPFKVMGVATLMDLVLRAPIHAKDLQGISGMTSKQIHRHRQGLLHAIQEGFHGPPQQPPQVDPESDDMVDRYDCLHTWRKKRACAVLWDLARRPPRTHGELADITDFGSWRRERYGEEILALLSGATP